MIQIPPKKILAFVAAYLAILTFSMVLGFVIMTLFGAHFPIFSGIIGGIIGVTVFWGHDLKAYFLQPENEIERNDLECRKP